MRRSNIRDRTILFLCRDNSCLSVIAEAIANKLLPPKTRVFGASVKQAKVDPKAFQVLREVGIDVPVQDAKGLDAIPAVDIDLIVTLGEADKAQAPASPSTKWRTWDISDPCREPGADLNAFRHARDEISNRIGGLFLDYWRNLA